MPESCIMDRLSKLRNLREALCNREKNWKEAFEARDWIVNQLNDILVMVRSHPDDIKPIEARIEEILVALDPEGETGE